MQLTFVQVLASALAAVTATVAASFLGVAGTVIGAALASVCTVVGNAVYGHSLARTRDRVRAVVPMPALRGGPAHTTAALTRHDGWGEATEIVSRAADEDTTWSTPRTVAASRRRTRAPRRRFLALALTVVGVFVGLLVAVTGVELATGTPISDLLRGQDAAGTTVLGSTTQHDSGSTPTTTRTGTTTGGSAGAGTPTSTTTVTVTPSKGTTTVTTTPSSGAGTSGSASSGGASTSGSASTSASSHAGSAGASAG